jgi:exodeoxyribonuclease VII large subunit
MTWDLFTSAEAAPREAEPTSPAAEWSVSEVNAAARELVEGAFPALRVVGEVSNFTRARSGHCYFSLRDESAQIRCVMWRDEARRLPTLPEEGMEVRALGRLSLYEPRGEFQLVVAELEGRGEGLWRLAMERLRARLDAEGLTDPLRKRPLPRVPLRIGVVTSPTGAVLHDIVKVVRRRAPWTRVVLAGCRVQGEGAAEEIAAAIRLLARANCVDVVIVARGGGSIEDLWAFNEEVVARAIAECPIPTISAVGHETDVTIADLVADLRAPTPSAAAEAAVPDGEVLRRELRARRGRGARRRPGPRDGAPPGRPARAAARRRPAPARALAARRLRARLRPPPRPRGAGAAPRRRLRARGGLRPAGRRRRGPLPGGRGAAGGGGGMRSPVVHPASAVIPSAAKDPARSRPARDPSLRSG